MDNREQEQNYAPTHFFVRLRTVFHDANPAGIVHSGRHFTLAHEAYEHWVTTLGLSWDEWFLKSPWVVAVKRVEQTFARPIFAGRDITARVAIAKLGTTSFALTIELNDGDELLTTIICTLVFLERKTGRATAIPSEIRERMTSPLA